jgi:predicted nucleic acid-binding protein
VTAPGRALLDTSVLIATESGRRIDEAALPDEVAVSVVTLAELQAGVLRAPDSEARGRRMATLGRVASMKVFPIDEDVASEWARLRVHLAEQGRRVNVNDLWIAASAVANGLPVVTQDDDFDPLDGVRGLVVVRV